MELLNRCDKYSKFTWEGGGNSVLFPEQEIKGGSIFHGFVRIFHIIVPYEYLKYD